MTDDEIKTAIREARAKADRGKEIVAEAGREFADAQRACSCVDRREVIGRIPNRPYRKFTCNVCGYSWRETNEQHNSHVQTLKQRALSLLREKREEGGADECYNIERLAKELGCGPLELYDRDHDSGVLFELDQDGDVAFTMCGTCVSPQNGNMEWGL